MNAPYSISFLLRCSGSGTSFHSADVQLVLLSSDNIISRQLINVLDTPHLHTLSCITASSHITTHCHTYCTPHTFTYAHILDTASFLWAISSLLQVDYKFASL